MNKKKKDRKEEINYIRELLQACLEEEGYNVVGQYADFRYKSFEIALRNPIPTSGERAAIKIEFENWE